MKIVNFENLIFIKLYSLQGLTESTKSFLKKQF